MRPGEAYNLTRKQNELIGYAIILKNKKKELKTHSIKTKEPLVEYNFVTDINL